MAGALSRLLEIMWTGEPLLTIRNQRFGGTRKGCAAVLQQRGRPPASRSCKYISRTVPVIYKAACFKIL